MSRPNFFNENANRTFPFRSGSAGIDTPASGSVTMKQLPDDFIVDCGFIMGPQSSFVEGEHQVYLDKIYRVGSSRLIYEFRCDAPDLAEVPLRFTRQVTDPEYRTEFVESDTPNAIQASLSESTSLSLSASGSEDCGEPYWSGYLVTGPLESVTDRLAPDTALTRSDSDAVLVEPTLIQNLNGSQVISLNLANADRTRARRPGDCEAYTWDFTLEDLYVNTECLQGDIKLRSGYNVALNQITLTNTLQFAAIVNAGQGEPCEEVPLFPGETPPVDSANGLLAGDFYCNEVLRTVNGLRGPNLVLFAGTGVSIIADNETNRVVIDVNLVDLTLCTYSTVSISESLSES